LSRNNWRDTAVVISSGVMILVVSQLLTQTGNAQLLKGITSILAPLVALFLGVMGLRIYGKESDTKDDNYATLNLWLAIGLIMLSFAELAISLLSLSQSPQEMILIVALVQLPGLILWGLGIIQYLRSLNLALGLVEANILWMGIFLITTLSTLCLIVIVAIQFPMIGMFESIILSPIIVGLTLYTAICVMFVWIFRKGSISKPLFLLLGALALYLARSILWLFAESSLGSPTDGVIAIEAFILCGAALLLARDLGSINT